MREALANVLKTEDSITHCNGITHCRQTTPDCSGGLMYNVLVFGLPQVQVKKDIYNKKLKN